MEQHFITRTGVHVGRLWVNRTQGRPIDDPDMQLLQTALTLTPLAVKQRRYQFIAYWIVAIGLIAFIVLAVAFKSHLSYANESHYKKQDHMLQFSKTLGDSNE